MANKRIFYATKGLAIKRSTSIGEPGTHLLQTSEVLPLSASGVNPSGIWEVPRGIQSATMTTTFNLEQTFQQGQISIYEQSEDRPDIEVSISRVLDGSHPLYLMASDSVTETPNVPISLNRRNADYKVDIAFLVYPEGNTHASGVYDSAVYASGMFLSSVSYTFPVDGAATEEITFVGNNKFLDTGSGGDVAAGLLPSTTAGNLISTDEDPGDLHANAGVVRREDINVGGTGGAVWPTEIPADDRSAIQNITVSADLGREEIFALGQRDAYHRTINFPLEVSCSFEAVTSEGDKIQAVSNRDNLTDQQIIITTTDGLKIDLGTRNKLQSVDLSGGDTGGGNVTATYNYTNFNDLTISHALFP